MVETNLLESIKKAAIVFLVLFLPAVGIELFDSLYSKGGHFSFSFDRYLIAEGQWWRMLVGHFDHLGWSHLTLNALFLCILLFTFPGMGSAMTLILIVCAYALGISALIWLFSPDLHLYVGLSGSLYGLLVFGLLRDCSFPLWLRWTVLLGLIIKVSYEYVYDASEQISEVIGGPVATDVHLYGALLGLISVVLFRIYRV